MNRSLSLNLTGARILVVEDEFYLAMDIKDGIERAGGAVLGPCADGASGISALLRERPDCAIVDINLGDGPSFDVAAELKRHGVPFVFITGYDAPSIPAELGDVERIEKPADTRRVIEALGRLAKRD